NFKPPESVRYGDRLAGNGVEDEGLSFLVEVLEVLEVDMWTNSSGEYYLATHHRKLEVTIEHSR
ncbi:hypothetical protein A2U01_0016175, partial [Trifolium medium]|nr:hypothetical protein [Trifolium medium]